MKNKINILDAIPVCNEGVVTTWKGECAELAFPRFKHAWMRRIFLPKGMSSHIHVTLEEKGSAVWRLIDGQKTVAEIVSLLENAYPDEREYASRIVAYIMQLQKDRFVRLLI